MGEPSIPTFAGNDTFKGTVVHCSANKGAREWKGKKAVVLGSGTLVCPISHQTQHGVVLNDENKYPIPTIGHDIAHEFYEGADVTMVQRSETVIITSQIGLPLINGLCGGRSTCASMKPSPLCLISMVITILTSPRLYRQEADLATISFPIRPFQPLLAHLHNLICELEKSLHDGLRAAGFKVAGEGSPGLLVKYWRDGGVRTLVYSSLELTLKGHSTRS
jgi:hypothetical protein